MPAPFPRPTDLPLPRASQGRQFVLSAIDQKQPVPKTEPPTTPAFRVVITDRDPMSSDLLAHALTKHGVCDAHAVNSSDLLQTLETRPADIAVIASDLNLGTRNAFDLAHAINQAHPNVIIVMILNQADRDAVIHAFRSGARGVFSRHQPMVHFLDCIQHLQKGYLWAGGEEAECLLDILKSLPAPVPLTAVDSPSLTERELQVVRLAAKGKTNRAIAGELNLSEHTVKNYLFRAFEKLGVSSRIELLFCLTVRGHSFTPTGTETV